MHYFKSVIILWIFPLIVNIAAAPLSDEEEDPLRLLMVAKMARNKNIVLSRFSSMYSDILRLSKTRPLHIIVLCDPEDVKMLNDLVQIIDRRLGKLPLTLKLEFVDINYITSRMQKPIKLIRKHFLKIGNSSRYYDDLFHIGEVYHRIFPFKRLIALDLDLKINVDLALLEKQFDNFNQTQVIGLSNDLSPHYWDAFSKYRKLHPRTNVGKPYPGLQGFNTGVLLLDLEKMRRSAIYNKYLDPEQLGKLCEEYVFEGLLAYQDYFTLLGMKHPELFYVLHCTWNRQLDRNSLRVEAFRPIFDKYHDCEGDVKIYHGNAGWDIPDPDMNNTLIS